MPIRKEMKALYPPDWKEISDRIRFDRAGGSCEECGAPHGALIVRSSIKPDEWLLMRPQDGALMWNDGEDYQVVREDDLDEQWSGKLIKVVLTVAHLNHNPADNREQNLAALCQRCHLAHDAKDNAEKAARSRRARRGQMELFTEGE